MESTNKKTDDSGFFLHLNKLDDDMTAHSHLLAEAFVDEILIVLSDHSQTFKTSAVLI